MHTLCQLLYPLLSYITFQILYMYNLILQCFLSYAGRRLHVIWHNIKVRETKIHKFTATKKPGQQNNLKIYKEFPINCYMFQLPQ